MRHTTTVFREPFLVWLIEDVLMKVKTANEEDVQRIPVVILTTSSAEQDVAKAYAHRANSYVLKPLDYEGFTTLVDRLGTYWFERNFYPWFSGLL